MLEFVYTFSILVMAQSLITVILTPIVTPHKGFDFYWLEFVIVGGLATLFGLVWKFSVNFWDVPSAHQVAFIVFGLVNLVLAWMSYVFGAAKYSELLRGKVRNN
jgi:hypothetical protein